MRSCKICGYVIKGDGICWKCHTHNNRPRYYENTSTNIGVPEKRRGWERADIQYHGDMFYSGEW